MWLLYFAQEVKHWWTHEADKHWDPPPEPELNHNLSVYSYDVQTSYSRTLGQIKAAIAEKPKGFLHLPITPHDVDRAARRVLVNAEDDWTLLDAARALGADGGIDTLVVELGANNVLDVVINLSYQWATSDEDRSHGHVWSPNLFDADWKAADGQGHADQGQAGDRGHRAPCDGGSPVLESRPAAAGQLALLQVLHPLLAGRPFRPGPRPPSDRRPSPGHRQRHRPVQRHHRGHRPGRPKPRPSLVRVRDGRIARPAGLASLSDQSGITTLVVG